MGIMTMMNILRIFLYTMIIKIKNISTKYFSLCFHAFILTNITLRCLRCHLVHKNITRNTSVSSIHINCLWSLLLVEGKYPCDLITSIFSRNQTISKHSEDRKIPFVVWKIIVLRVKNLTRLIELVIDSSWPSSLSFLCF